MALTDKLDDYDARLLRVFADNDMLGSKTAKVFRCSTKLISRNLDLIQKKTGLDPRRFWNLVKLLAEIQKGGSA
ncbi:MAG: hypothetical protein IJH37_05110 [Clostridia bacterium]|nr:hypothetical protein [Clostridia bacterium]